MGDFIDLKFEAAPADSAAADAPEGYIAGWASTPDLDSHYDIVLPGAFDDSIKERGLMGPKGIKLLVGHDSNKVAGVIHKLETRDGRLWLEAQMNLAVSYARDVYEISKMAGGMSFSIGFKTEKRSFSEDRSVRFIEKGDLREVSVVAFPSNRECVMTVIKSEDVTTAAEFERFLVSNGLVQSRNAAQRVTRAVKEHAHLFTAKSEQVEEVEKPLMADYRQFLDQIKETLK